MPTSLAEIYLHLIFSTKRRTAWLADQPLRTHLHAYIGGICRNLNAPSLAIGGVADHIHILLRMPRDISLATLLREIKRSSTVWIRRQPGGIREFHWQDGYCAFSASPAHVRQLMRYIATQEEHHRKEDFKVELIRVLDKYNAKYDERHLFD